MRAPEVSGVKVTSIVQVAPETIEVGQLVVKAKSPFSLRDEIESNLGPLLVNVTVCAGLVVETARAAKVSEDGVSVTFAAGAAVPLSSTRRPFGQPKSSMTKSSVFAPARNGPLTVNDWNAP